MARYLMPGASTRSVVAVSVAPAGTIPWVTPDAMSRVIGDATPQTETDGEAARATVTLTASGPVQLYVGVVPVDALTTTVPPPPSGDVPVPPLHALSAQAEIPAMSSDLRVNKYII